MLGAPTLVTARGGSPMAFVFLLFAFVVGGLVWLPRPGADDRAAIRFAAQIHLRRHDRR